MTPVEELRHSMNALVWSEEQAQGAGLAYRGMADFVLQHGERFDSIALPEEYEYGAERACYGNALLLAILYDELTYVEGYASSARSMGFAIPHAWNVDKEGRLLDITWRAVLDDDDVREPIDGAAYLGVRFSVGRAADAIHNGDTCVLDDWMRDWPLLQQPWKGEDWEREWKETPPERVAKALLGT